MLYPLVFHPIFKDRVWGGRSLERLYAKPLPPAQPIGESWEICDRPGDASVIANGPLAGRDLHWLMVYHGAELLGAARSQQGRFPLLIKILDAQDQLSLQVHPPPRKAAALGGEPKTEMWYLAAATAAASLYVGLKAGTTRADFERRLHDGTVADCFHRVGVRAGDAMFLPSGRVHAIGAGCLIFEIQQNSDTTYRVFDWNRVGLDGRPRDLHLPESLASIDFDDFEPGLLAGAASDQDGMGRRPLIDDPLFQVDQLDLPAGPGATLTGNRPVILGVLAGTLNVTAAGTAIQLSPGGFGLIPASALPARLESQGATRLLRAVPG
jgi:mannose-6-phosphate isomerase